MEEDALGMWEEVLGFQDIGDDVTKLNDFLERDYFIVRCDASYKKGVGSCSIQIEKKDRQYAIKNHTFTSKGPVYSEIKAIVYGLKELGKIKNVKKTLIINDSYYAINFAVGNFKPQKPHIKEIVDKLKEEKNKLNCELEFGWVKSKINRRVDRIAKKTLREKEEEIKNRIDKRINHIKNNIEKAKNLQVYKKIDKTVLVKSEKTEKWYEVKFDPYPSCSCQWWKKNWGNKDIKIIKSRALPCKHMCKAAEILKIDIFEVFKRQIFRRS